MRETVKKPCVVVAVATTMTKKTSPEEDGDVIIIPPLCTSANRSRLQAGSHCITPTNDDMAEFQQLPNGDLYTGTFWEKFRMVM